MIDWVQQCTRCLKILTDYRDAQMPEGSPTPRGWSEGIVIEEGNYWSTADTPRAVDCEPMDIVDAFEHDEEV